MVIATIKQEILRNRDKKNEHSKIEIECLKMNKKRNNYRKNVEAIEAKKK